MGRTTYEQIDYNEWRANRKCLRALDRTPEKFSVKEDDVLIIGYLLRLMDVTEQRGKQYGAPIFKGELLHQNFSVAINQLAAGDLEVEPVTQDHSENVALRKYIRGLSLDFANIAHRRNWGDCEFSYTGNKGLFDWLELSPYSAARAVEYELGQILFRTAYSVESLSHISDAINPQYHGIYERDARDDWLAEQKKKASATTGAEENISSKEDDNMNVPKFQCTPDTFGSLPAEQFDEVYLQLIATDLADAQSRLNELPESDRRGLTLDTLRHFNCGYLPNWVLTQCRAKFLCGTYVKDTLTCERKSLPPPSPRIIVPTSDKQFNGVATDSARSSMNKDFWKQHAGAMKGELFNATDALKHDLIVVVEGEIDAMSIWQATQGNVASVAILGCSNWKTTLLPRVNEFKGKKLLLLLDADAPGKKAAKKFLDELSGLDLLAVNRTLYDAMTPNDQKEFGCRPKEVDANSLLRHFDDKYLDNLLGKIIADAEPAFAYRQKELDEQERERREYAAMPDPDWSALKLPQRSPKETAARDIGDIGDGDSLDADEIKLILKDFVHARDLGREDWRDVGWIMRDNGFAVEDFKAWSNDGDRRYSEKACNSVWKSKNGRNKPVTVGTLIYLAKKKGYTPKRKSAADEVFAGLADDVRDKINQWQSLNGKINPDVLTKLIDAKKYLDALEIKDITSEAAQSSQTKHAVALCKAYDCFIGSADTFLAKLERAKNTATVEIKQLQEAGGDFVSEPPPELLAVKNLSVTPIKTEIGSLTKSYKKAHKEYVKAEEQRKVREDAERKRQIKLVELSDARERLEKLKQQTPCPERDAAIVETIRQLCTWKHDKLGNPVAVEGRQENADWIFDNDPDLNGLFAYDEFTDANVFLKAPPWNKNIVKGTEWQDADDAQLRVLLRRRYTEFTNDNLVYDNVTDYAKHRRFNVVKEYFKSLPAWDGKPRAETFFIDWLNVADTEYARAVTMNWLLGATARIFFPGCEYQTVLVLQGKQGVGKDFNLQQLANGWHSAITDNLDSGDAIDVLKLTWLGVFEEMHAVSKSSVNAVKSFISRNTDVRREKYGRRAKRIARHCVFAITTNDQKFLNDVTGNRRYLILNCGGVQSKPVTVVRGERLTDSKTVAQIWAEVYARYQEIFKGITDIKLVAEKLRLPEEITRQAAEIAEHHLNDNGGADSIICQFVDNKILDPVIWSLLSREQRRQFFVEKSITLDQAVLNFKRRARGGRNVQEDINAIYNACRAEGVRKINLPDGRELYQFFGSHYRQHICAAEILDECFDKTDKRRSPVRINELLARLEGWALGKRICRDACYGDQRNVYWRDADNIPNVDDDDPADTPPARGFDDFGGEPIDPEDSPFDNTPTNSRAQAETPRADANVAVATANNAPTPANDTTHADSKKLAINLFEHGWRDVKPQYYDDENISDTEQNFDHDGWYHDVEPQIDFDLSQFDTWD